MVVRNWRDVASWKATLHTKTGKENIQGIQCFRWVVFKNENSQRTFLNDSCLFNRKTHKMQETGIFTTQNHANLSIIYHTWILLEMTFSAVQRPGVRVAWFIWAPVDFGSVKPNRDSAGIIEWDLFSVDETWCTCWSVWRHFPPKNLGYASYALFGVENSWWPPQCGIHYQCTRVSGFELHNFNMVFKLPFKLFTLSIRLDPGKLAWQWTTNHLKKFISY